MKLLQITQKCTNIIECQTGDHNCDTDNHAYCIDKNGGFVCACEPGFEGDGVKTDATPVPGTSCTDMDNCQYCPGGGNENPDLCVCGADATCQEIPGSYECVCDTAGYFSNGADCFDENECLAMGSTNVEYSLNDSRFGSVRVSLIKLELITVTKMLSVQILTAVMNVHVFKDLSVQVLSVIAPMSMSVFWNHALPMLIAPTNRLVLTLVHAKLDMLFSKIR